MVKSLLFDNTIGEIKSDTSSGIYIFNGTLKEWTLTKNPYTGFPINNKLYKFFIGDPLVNTEWVSNKEYDYGDCVIHTMIDDTIKYYVCIKKHISSNTELINDKLVSMYWQDYTSIMNNINPYDFITTYKLKYNYCSSSEDFSRNSLWQYSYYTDPRTSDIKDTIRLSSSNLYAFPSNDYCSIFYPSIFNNLSDYYLKYNYKNYYGKKTIFSTYVLPNAGGNKYLSLTISNNYVKEGYSVIFDLTTNEQPVKIKESYINPTTYSELQSISGFDINESSYGISNPIIKKYIDSSGHEKTFTYYRIWIEAKVLGSGNNNYLINTIDLDENNQLQYRFKVSNDDSKYQTCLNGCQVEFVNTINGVQNISPNTYVKTYKNIKNIFVKDKIYQKNSNGVINEYIFSGHQPNIYFFNDKNDFINDTENYSDKDIAIINNYIKLKSYTSKNDTINPAGAIVGSITFPVDAKHYYWLEEDIGQIAYETSTNKYYAHLNDDTLNTVKLKTNGDKNARKAILQALLYNADQYGFYSHVKGNIGKLKLGVNGGGCYTPKKY